MSLSFSVFKPKFRKTIADAVYQEVTSKTALYYHWFGKENPWTDFLSPFIGSSAGDFPGAPSNNFRYDLHVRRDILTAKLIKPSDISYVVRRIDWVEGEVYDMYDDSYDTNPNDPSGAYGVEGAMNLEDAKFFVLTLDFNVYKCIWNNNNSPSTFMPTGTSEKIFKTADGYKWKFMYSIPVSLRNRFLTDDYMPISNAFKAAYYSNGELTNIFIQNGGSGYNPATTTAVITGDGYKESNPYAITSIDVINPTTGNVGGSGYLQNAGDFIPTIDANIIIPGNVYTIASLGDTDFTAIGAISNTVGVSFRATDAAPSVGVGETIGTVGFVYEITDPGDTDFTAIGAANNVIGTQFIPTGVGSGTGQAKLLPKIFVDYPFPSATNFEANGSVSKGQYLRVIDNSTLEEHYYYVVLGTSVGATPPVNHFILQSEQSGSSSLKYVGKNAVANFIMDSGDDSIESVYIDDIGIGYQGKPLIAYTKPRYTQLKWIASTLMILNNIIKYEDRYYKVVTAGVTSTIAPTHVTGIESNGGSELEFVAQDPNLLPVVVKTEAEIALQISPKKDSVFSIIADKQGTKYSEIPTVTIASPGAGSSAIATATIGALGSANEGKVITFVVQDGGNGYTANPAVTISAPKITFNGDTAVDNSARTIFYPKHKFETGDAVIYDDGGDTNIVNLTSGETYYVKYDSDDTLKLATTYSNALANITINITKGSGSSHTLQQVATKEQATAIATLGTGGEIVGFEFIDKGVGYTEANIQILDTNSTRIFEAETAVSTLNDEIELFNFDGISGHALTTGTEVIYSKGAITNTAVGGLNDGGTYYVITSDPTHVKLALSAALATSGTYISITSTGTGEGHTFTIATAGQGAVLIADFDVGNVDTLQANVELLAVPGSIETIKMVNGGSNYSSATINILGDGFGATAVATCAGGKVTHIEITNPGSGYSWTDVIITGNVGSDGGAVARAIMSPLGGHGSNAIDELNANSLVFYTSISRDFNQGIEITNDYRKVGLIRNLKQFGSNKRFTEDTGSGCILIEGTFDKTQLEPDMLLYKVEPGDAVNYKKYRIIEYNDTQILLSVFNNFTLAPGDQIITDPTNNGKIANPTVSQISFFVDKVYERTIDQFSGDFLFFSVREPYAPTSEQIITVRTKITL